MPTLAPTAAPFALARYRADDGFQLGLVVADRIRPLSDDDLGAPGLNAFLASPDWERLAALASEEGLWRPLSDVTLTAPVEPRQVLQTGANYRTHVIDLVVAARQKNDPRPVEELREWAGALMDDRKKNGLPYFFIGLTACVVGDDVPLTLPAYSEEHDWELELAVVIGQEAFRVSADDAMQHVAGYTIVNDVTTRDLVFRDDLKDLGTDWYRGKNAPGFLPAGPFIVPAQFVDAGDLELTLDLNGQVMQSATTKDLLFDVPALVSAASWNMPLLPGDLLLTGSPAGNGVAWGRMLRDGDVMTGTIKGLGTQVVRCVGEDVK